MLCAFTWQPLGSGVKALHEHSASIQYTASLSPVLRRIRCMETLATLVVCLFIILYLRLLLLLQAESEG